jgi:tetratricopeptide (TPR) repeat protein
MTREKFLVGALVVLLPLAAYLLLPRAEERFSILMREGQYRDAAVELEALVAAGDRRPFVLAALARAYEATGALARAVEIMRSYVSAYPRDPEGRRALVHLYVAANDPQATTDALSELVAIEPTKESVVRLAALYRGFGRFDDERRLLLQFREGEFLDVWYLQRLGELLAATGDLKLALSVLAQVDERLPPDQERGRILLFDLLVSQGQGEQAVRRAIRWLQDWQRPWVAMRLVQHLAADKTKDDHIERLAALAARLHPDMKLPIAAMLVQQRRVGVARNLLAIDALTAKIEASEAPTDSDISDLQKAAGVLRDPGLLSHVLATIMKKPAAAVAQVRLAEALLEQFGVDALTPLGNLLPFEAVSHRPLFAARLLLYENNRLLARKILEKIDARRLSSAERRTWEALMAESQV